MFLLSYDTAKLAKAKNCLLAKPISDNMAKKWPTDITDGREKSFIF